MSDHHNTSSGDFVRLHVDAQSGEARSGRIFPYAENQYHGGVALPVIGYLLNDHKTAIPADLMGALGHVISQYGQQPDPIPERNAEFDPAFGKISTFQMMIIY